MSTAVDRIAKALLYEGYMLYPYRPSAIKNQQRFNFGVLYPCSYSRAQDELEPWFTRTECLVTGSVLTSLEVRVRFLHLCDRTIQRLTEDGLFQPVDRLEVAGQVFQSWQEAVEEEIILPVANLQSLAQIPLEWPCLIAGKITEEPIVDEASGTVVKILRTRRELRLSLRVTAKLLSDSVSKVSARVENLTDLAASLSTREAALLHSPVSTHTLLGVQGGEFVSLLETPEELVPFARDCISVGCYPVLAGDRDTHDTVLSSPIILYDYPEVASESDGDLFDSTEIDEILSLRIMTLTDEEKREVRNADDRTRRILERTENLPQEQLLKLHGVLRGLRPSESDLR